MDLVDSDRKANLGCKIILSSQFENKFNKNLYIYQNIKNHKRSQSMEGVSIDIR